MCTVGRVGGEGILSVRFTQTDDSMTRLIGSNGGAPDDEPERQVIEAAQTGDLEALSHLYDTHINQVYRYALARLANVQDAEDVAEEIFLKMLNGLPSYQWRRVPFSAWLMRIARNEVISFARRTGRRPQAELSDDIEDRHNGDLVEETERVMALEDLRTAVTRLPEAQREVIILRFASGLSVADTAKALGKRENNVKVLQHKGMQHLAKLMAPKYPELSERRA